MTYPLVRAGLAALGLFAVATVPCRAGTNEKSLDVSMTISEACTVTDPLSLDFGDHPISSPTVSALSGQLRLSCTNASVAPVLAISSLHVDPANPGHFFMQDSSGNKIFYTLSMGSSPRSNGESNIGVSGTGPVSISTAVDTRLTPDLRNMPPGVYRDTITLTISPTN